MAPVRGILLAMALLVGLAASQAQEVPVPSRVITIADGLPQSYIVGMVQDATGFVWIATKDGLARYDGRKMKRYRHRLGDSASLADNVITSLHKDREQRLWIFYGQGDIDLLDTRTEVITHLTADPVYRQTKARFPVGLFWAQDAQGRVWMRALKNRETFFRFDLRRHALHIYNAMSVDQQHTAFGSIATIGDTLWHATNKGLYYLSAVDEAPKAKLATTRAHPNDTISGTCIWVISSPGGGKELLMVGDKQIGIFNPGNRTFRTLESPRTRFIFVTPSLAIAGNGDVFVSISDTIFRYRAPDQWTVWRPNTAYHDAISLLADRSGVLWVGGNASGIQQYDLRLSRMRSRSYTKKFVFHLFEDLLGLSADGVRLVSTIGDSYAFRWTRDRDGSYWMLQGGPYGVIPRELIHLQSGTVSAPLWKYKDLGASRKINVLNESTTGVLWGVDYGLKPYRFTLADSSVVDYPAIRLPDNHGYLTVNSLIADGEDTLWISTQGTGLIRYVVHSGHLDLYNQPGMAELTCMSRDPSDANILWIGSLGSGLIRFDKRTGQARHLTTDDGLPDNTVYAALPDRRSRLWCSTNRGIFRYDPKDGVIRSFTMQDGLSDDEFNRFHFFALPDGRMCFGGLNGYTVFDPEAITTDTFAPPIVLTGLTINGRNADFCAKGSPLTQPLNQLTRLTLPPNQNFLTFEFAALEYNNPTGLQYRYMLQGLDEHWVEAGTSNMASYTALPPGDYELCIMATNAGGVWGKEIKRLSITILPPFWRTWWFALLCLGVVALAVVLVFRARVGTVRRNAARLMAVERAAMELEAEALRAQMNPHFIFNCLNSIKSLIQEGQDLQAIDYLTTFAKLIRTQLTSGKDEITLHEELDVCRLYARMEALRFEEKIDVRFELHPAADLHSVMVPPLLLQPLLENAIWHGVLPKDSGGLITVSVSDQGHELACVIDDNGIGRGQSAVNKTAKAALHVSKGLELIRKRLEVHNQLHGLHHTIRVEDKTNAAGRSLGTRITLTFQKRPE